MTQPPALAKALDQKTRINPQLCRRLSAIGLAKQHAGQRQQTILEGGKVLLAFVARCVPGSTGDESGCVAAVVENKEPGFTKLGQDGIEKHRTTPVFRPNH